MRNLISIISDKSHYFDQVSFVFLNFSIIYLASEILILDEGVHLIWIMSICGLIVTLSSSLVVTPLMVFWCKYHKRKNPVLVVSYIVIFSLITIIISLLIIYDYLICDIGISHSEIIFLLCYAIYDFSRRSMYVLDKGLIVSIVSILVLFFFSLSILLLESFNKLSSYSIFSSASVAFIVGMGVFLFSQYKNNAFDLLPRHKDFKVIITNQYDYAKFSIGSSLVIWLAMQGPFTFLRGFMPENEYLASRVYLSVTGIIGVLFVAFENKILPMLSELHQKNEKYKFNTAIKKLNRPLINIMLFGSILSISVILFFFPESHKYFGIGILYLCFQCLIGFSKSYTLIAKVRLKQSLMLWVNLISLVLVCFTVGYFLKIAPSYVAVSCTVMYGFSQYILFYFLNRYGRI